MRYIAQCTSINFYYYLHKPRCRSIDEECWFGAVVWGVGIIAILEARRGRDNAGTNVDLIRNIKQEFNFERQVEIAFRALNEKTLT